MKNKTPYFLYAKRAGVCPETGKKIKPGDKIAYFPLTRTAYHIDSKAAEQVRGLEFNRAFNMLDANW